MKGAECAESKKKSIFRFFFLELIGHFCTQITPIFDEFLTITEKSQKKMYFVFHSIQHIPHLS